jgi:dolichol-phosphate mannosyltransferase
MVAATILELLVGTAGLSPLAAQPAAVIAATPLSFLGSKKWSFAEPASAAAPALPAVRPNTWLVVPTYNEAENLEPFVRKVLPRLASAAGEHRVLIVDDSSPDGTGEIADRLASELEAVEVLHRAEKDGLGRAYAAGFERALAEGAELVMQMDVDFSHDPKHIPALIAAAADADLVIGSRYVAGGGVTDWGLARRLLSRGGSWYARTVLRVPVKDLTGGFKCFRRELLEGLSPRSFHTAGFGFQVETTYRAVRAGARVREVPIRFRDRQAGTSKMSSRIVVEALWRVVALRLRAERPAFA